MTRKRLRPAHVLLAAGLLLTPVVLILDWAGLADELVLFVLAALALLPLSWVIGEATDQLANHTGPGIGGFLNATFGNAPELIIALIAVSSGLTEIVRASLVGSVAGNLLLVLGLTLLLGRQGPIDRPVRLPVPGPGRVRRSPGAGRGHARLPRRREPPVARRAVGADLGRAAGRMRGGDQVRAAPPPADRPGRRARLRGRLATGGRARRAGRGHRADRAGQRDAGQHAAGVRGRGAPAGVLRRV